MNDGSSPDEIRTPAQQSPERAPLRTGIESLLPGAEALRRETLYGDSSLVTDHLQLWSVMAERQVGIVEFAGLLPPTSPPERQPAIEIFILPPDSAYPIEAIRLPRTPLHPDWHYSTAQTATLEVGGEGISVVGVERVPTRKLDDLLLAQGTAILMNAPDSLTPDEASRLIEHRFDKEPAAPAEDEAGDRAFAVLDMFRQAMQQVTPKKRGLRRGAA